MARTALIAAIVVAALASSALAATRFTSHRYHYSIAVPAGYRVTPATVNVVPGFYPSAGDSTTDMLVKGEADIGIASVPIAAQDAPAWAASRVTQIAHQYNCTRPARRVTRIDGVTASELVYPDCFGYFDAIEAAHGGRGYDVYLLEPEKNAKDVATFRAAVASLRFG